MTWVCCEHGKYDNGECPSCVTAERDVLAEEIARLEKECDSLARERDRAIEAAREGAREAQKLLRHVEWEGGRLGYECGQPVVKPRCPCCYGPKGRHEDDCALAGALSEAGARSEAVATEREFLAKRVMEWAPIVRAACNGFVHVEAIRRLPEEHRP